jgi:hypothetical protein
MKKFLIAIVALVVIYAALAHKSVDATQSVQSSMKGRAQAVEAIVDGK